MNHQEAIELLPWYANQTQPREQHELVEQHLRDCAECARELVEIERLRRTAAAVADATPEPSPFLFTRMMARIDDHERQKAERRWWHLSPKVAAFALLAQFLLIVTLGAFLLRPGADSGTAGGPSTGPRIAVGFQAGVTEAAMRSAIEEINGTIVDGPTASGLYKVRVEQGAIEKAMAILTKNQQVVRVVALEP